MDYRPREKKTARVTRTTRATHGGATVLSLASPVVMHHHNRASSWRRCTNPRCQELRSRAPYPCRSCGQDEPATPIYLLPSTPSAPPLEMVAA